MQRSGAGKFTDAHDYQANIHGATFDLILNCQKGFEAKLTWVDLRHLHLLRGQENLPRVAHASLASDLVFVAFPARHDQPQIWNGVELQLGDIVFHGRGEHVHQRTLGPSQWGWISAEPEYLAASINAITEFDLGVTPVGRILRPHRRDGTRLLRLHAKACRLAEKKPGLIVHPEVARALEQELLHALVNCLTSRETHKYDVRQQRHMKIIARFEDVLAANSARQLQIPELCKAIGVSERTLRTCCANFLGMSPNRYLRLQHLNMVRAALRHVEAPSVTVSDLATRFGFWELGRFAGIYQAVFGETPSSTLRSAQISRRSQTSAEIA
jgi:AraC-like DNA-binding protein